MDFSSISLEGWFVRFVYCIILVASRQQLPAPGCWLPRNKTICSMLGLYRVHVGSKLLYLWPCWAHVEPRWAYVGPMLGLCAMLDHVEPEFGN